MFLTTPTHSTVLASLANAFRIPLARHQSRVQSLPKSKILHNLSKQNSQQISAFSTTAALAKRKGGFKPDRRITLIRYFLYHPLTPRPLRFSRNRYLRHWTIHRAWQLYQTKLRAEQERELYRQQQAMSSACEELRTACGERGAKLFRVSMNKRGIFTDLFPIEYARLQTDSPAREGWNHGWKRM